MAASLSLQPIHSQVGAMQMDRGTPGPCHSDPAGGCSCSTEAQMCGGLSQPQVPISEGPESGLQVTLN